MVDMVFGSQMFCCTLPQVDSEFEVQNLRVMAPIRIRGKIVNLGSPVDRHIVPFWVWVAQNIYCKETLATLTSLQVPYFPVHSSTNVDQSTAAILACNFAFLD